MRAVRAALRLLPLTLAPACVAYDTAGPDVPSIDGTYDALIVVHYANYIELRTDTLAASLTLRDLHYRGTFDGTYTTAFGDSGLVAGVERPEGTLVLTVFGAPPKPLAYIMGLRQLYAWCDFSRLAPDPVTGRLRRDSLLVDARAAVPCFYQLYDEPVEVGTELRIRVNGLRGPE